MENNGVEQIIYDKPQKSYVVTLLLSFFLGFLGIHRFYTGYIVIGIVQLLTLGGCGFNSSCTFNVNLYMHSQLVTNKFKCWKINKERN